MKIRFDFDFVDEVKQEGFSFGDDYITSQEIKDIFSAANSVRTWAQNSIFKNCFDKIDIFLSDCPAENFLAQVDADPFTKKVYVEANVLDMIFHYRNSPINSILFKKDVTLFQYACFFLLHELGHIVHCHLQMNDSKSLYEKMEDYSFKYDHFHHSLFLKYGYADGYEVQKAYRTIPSERTADAFAKKYFKNIKRL